MLSIHWQNVSQSGQFLDRMQILLQINIVLNRVCDLLLCEQVVSQQDVLMMENNSNKNNNNNKNINNKNNNNKNSIQLSNVINELLSLPPPTPQHNKPQNIITHHNNNSNPNKYHQQQHLLLLVADSLIFNLYGRSKKIDGQKLNNSFFNNSSSMSMSQMSDQWSQHNYSVINNNINQNQLLRLALSNIQGLVMSDVFYKRLKVYYQRQLNKNRNHHYLENLLQTLQYILNKQKLTHSKEHFLKQRNIYFKTFLHSSTPVTFIPNSNQQLLANINAIVFSDQLDKVIGVISHIESNTNRNNLNVNSNTNQNTNTNNQNIININVQQLLFSINRVYFVARKGQTRKHFRGIKHSAQDMFLNLSKLYIHSFTSRLSTLQQSRHPVFLLLKSYLQVFYLPVFKKFSDLIMQLCVYYNGNPILFYQQNQQILERVLIEFVDELPVELIQFLSVLFRLVESQPLLLSIGNNNKLSFQQLNNNSRNNHGVNNNNINKNNTNNSNGLNNQSTQQKSSVISSCMIVIKRFLIYSFLCQPQLMKQFVFTNNSNNSKSNNINTNNNKTTNSTTNINININLNNSNNNNINNNDNNNNNQQCITPTPTTTSPLQHYQQVCNCIINIFFSSSIKKYTPNYTLQQLSPLIQLTQSIQSKLQQKILSFTTTEFCYYQQQVTSLLDNYFIQQPILNYDYHVLANAINQIQFTPKDDKRYPMITYSSIFTNSNNNNINLITHNNNNPITNITNNHNSNQHSKYTQNNNNVNNNKQQKPYNHHYKQQDMFLKTNQFHRNNKRQLTLSPNKFSFIEQKESLNATLTGGLSLFNRGQHHLTTPGFYLNQQQQYQHNYNDQSELDLLTWMTIGGTHNYKQRVSARKIKLSKTLNDLQQNNNKSNINMNNTQNNVNTFNNLQLKSTYNLQAQQNNTKHHNNQQDIDYNQNQSYQKFEHYQSKLNNKQQQDTNNRNNEEQSVKYIMKGDNKKKRQFKTFNRQKIKEINRLYQEYSIKNVYI